MGYGVTTIRAQDVIDPFETRAAAGNTQVTYTPATVSIYEPAKLHRIFGRFTSRSPSGSWGSSGSLVFRQDMGMCAACVPRACTRAAINPAAMNTGMTCASVAASSFVNSIAAG